MVREAEPEYERSDMTIFQQKIMRILMGLMWRVFHKKGFKAPPGIIRLDVTPDTKNSPRLILTMEQSMSTDKNPIKHISFTPDEVVSSEIFRGKLIICTRDAIWEVFEDENVLRKKLIAHIHI